MASPSYTNKDLKRLPSKPLQAGSLSKVYSNKDLIMAPDDFQADDDFQEDKSKHPLDDFEPDEVPESTITAVPNNAPDTFRKGFVDSIMNGEALDTGLRGAKGYLKGAIRDIPSSIYGGIKQAVTHPIDTALSTMGPLGDVITGRDSMAPVRKASAEAGGNPEAFGEMMGQMAGQPAVTAGLVKAAPIMTRAAGYPVEAAGNVMDRFRPISGSIPTYAARRVARMAERPIGKGLQRVGQAMKGVGLDAAENKPDVPLPEQVIGASPDADIQAVLSKPPKPKVRLNPDGTYTNFDTGEIVDSRGKPMAAPVEPKLSKEAKQIKPNERTIDNAPPNQRAKILRGMHDPVDILFEDPADREIFGAGQKWNYTGKSNEGLAQRHTQASEQVSKKYGLPVEAARKMVGEYNKNLRELAKNFPSHGESLNFKAPSFDQFIQNYKPN